MATKIFRGDAPAVAQVTALVVAGTQAIGNTFTVTLNGKSVTATATDGSAVTTCGLIVAAWQALDPDIYPEFAEITASQVTGENTVYLTAATPGVPFGPITLSEVSSGATFTQSSVTASSGPNDWSTSVNWSPSGVPATGDTVYISETSTDILYGLSQSSNTLAALYIDSTFTGTLGLPIINENAASYVEYRPTYLAIGATTTQIGQGSGNGSERIKINYGSTNGTCNIYTSASAADSSGAIQLLTNYYGFTCNVYGGNVGMALNPGETSVIGTINVVKGGTSSSNQATVNLGAVTIETILNVTGGTITCLSSPTALNLTNGTVTIVGSGTTTTVTMANGTLQIGGGITTCSIDNGTMTYTGPGTISTLNVGNQATVLFTADISSRTITNCNIYGGATFTDSFRTVTFTNPFALVRCKIGDCKIDLGDNIKLQVTDF